MEPTLGSRNGRLVKSSRRLAYDLLPPGGLRDRMAAFAGLPPGEDVSVDYLMACTDAVMVGLVEDIQAATDDGRPVSHAHVSMYAALAKVALSCRMFEVNRRVAAGSVMDKTQAADLLSGVAAVVQEALRDAPNERKLEVELALRELAARVFPQVRGELDGWQAQRRPGGPEDQEPETATGEADPERDPISIFRDAEPGDIEPDYGE